MRKMNNQQALYLLWATILNQSQNAEQVLKNTVELFNRLGLKDDYKGSYSKLDYEKIDQAMRQRPCLHRFPRNMSINLFYSIYLINEEYNGMPSKIFEGNTNIENVKEKLMKFRGIGEHKADTAITILLTYNSASKTDIISKSKCTELYKTIWQEIEILDSLGEDIDYDR